jgi:Spy/CpxP family protein refolding chaperone
METPTPSPASSTRRTAILLVAVAFVAGALIGFAGGRVYSIYRLFHRPESATRGILRHLDRELKLNPQQHDQVAAILDRHHKRMQSIMDTVRPQMHQELDAANKEIGAVLTPEQRKKFEEMQLRMQRLRVRRHEGEPAPPPPGT